MYTVTNSMNAVRMSKYTTDRLADAAFMKLAWETNEPDQQVSIFDADGYIVPSTEIENALIIKKTELLKELAYFK